MKNQKKLYQRVIDRVLSRWDKDFPGDGMGHLHTNEASLLHSGVPQLHIIFELSME